METRVFREVKEITVKFLGATLLSAEEVQELQDRIPPLESDMYEDQWYLREGPQSSCDIPDEEDDDDDWNEIGDLSDDDFGDEDDEDMVHICKYGSEFDVVMPDECDEFSGYPVTRPALIIDREASNVQVGDIIEAAGKRFTVISEKIALMNGCINEIADWSEFSSLLDDTYCFDESSTDYEDSNVKNQVDSWYRKNFGEIK